MEFIAGLITGIVIMGIIASCIYHNLHKFYERRLEEEHQRRMKIIEELEDKKMNRLDYWLDLIDKAFTTRFRGDEENRNALWQALMKIGWFPWYTNNFDSVISALEAVLRDIKKGEKEKNEIHSRES